MTKANPTPLLLPAPRHIPGGIPALVEMLKTCRPHGGIMDGIFCKQWLAPLGAEPDAFGNYILRVGDSPIMYSSHTDTVHWKDGTQRLHVDAKTHMIRLAKKSRRKSACLGADCTAGVWIMREMILAGKPGLYIFHRGEECGGIGSGELTEFTPHVVDGIKAAIAFDRRRTGSIITHQAGGRCASEAFADSLGDALHLGHKPDSGGTFTDTANYTDLIGECTNVSVGFENEHTRDESLDVAYLSELRHAMIELDTDSLVFSRKPGEHEPRPRSSYYGFTGKWSKGKGVFLENESASLATTSSVGKYGGGYEEDDSEILRELIVDNPGIIADLLDSYGLDLREVADWVYARGGRVPVDLFADPLDDEDETEYWKKRDAEFYAAQEAAARDEESEARREKALADARALFDKAADADAQGKAKEDTKALLARADAAIAKMKGKTV